MATCWKPARPQRLALLQELLSTSRCKSRAKSVELQEIEPRAKPYFPSLGGDNSAIVRAPRLRAAPSVRLQVDSSLIAKLVTMLPRHLAVRDWRLLFNSVRLHPSFVVHGWPACRPSMASVSRHSTTNATTKASPRPCSPPPRTLHPGTPPPPPSMMCVCRQDPHFSSSRIASSTASAPSCRRAGASRHCWSPRVCRQVT